MNSSVPRPPANPLIQFLRDGQYDQLQTDISAQQAAFERGDGRASDLQKTFKQFDHPDPTLGQQLGEWMEVHPGSYAAHTALATWMLSRAWAMRGGSTMNLVSDQGRRGMHHFLEQAEACARHALALTSNPLSAWLVVTFVHNTTGCEVALADVEAGKYPDWYTQPLSSNPASLELRRAMLLHLRAEWGGSETQMLTYVRQQQEAGVLSEPDMQKLWAEFHARVAHHAWMFSQEPDKALERARLAADLDDEHTELLFGFVSLHKHPLAERREAMERYLTFAEREVGRRTLGLWYARGAWLGSLDLLAAVAERLGWLLAAMAEAGEHDAAWLLGALALKMPQLRFPDPLPLLLRARVEGDVECADMAVWVAEGREHDQSRTTREHILKAADLGSKAMSWEIYNAFPLFRDQFDLDERARYRYLLQAADAGNNDARFALAQQLRAGKGEVGEDGVLRPVETAPLQYSLEYAKHLLERAAAEGHSAAEKVLRTSKDSAWDAKTAKRIRVGAGRPSRRWAMGQVVPHLLHANLLAFRVSWLVGIMLLLGGVRACSSQSFTPQQEAQQAGRELLEQIIEDQQRSAATPAKSPAAGGERPVLPPGMNSLPKASAGSNTP
ncbi:hypothetical protein ACFFLM_11465 [Deinococcus oregonensis]|uniref:DUF4034 domain-containing protein n=1 Tax=Deinococcus oregonensis TaxID=1805970 RepID=A0ABV6B0S1_9DEIO